MAERIEKTPDPGSQETGQRCNTLGTKTGLLGEKLRMHSYRESGGGKKTEKVR